MGVAAVTLAGCTCSRDSVTETSDAAMASYPTELTACIVDDQGCAPLCRAVFRIGDAEIRRCVLMALDGRDPGTLTGKPWTPADLQQVRGARVRVTYVREACADGVSGDDGYDQSTDDGSTDDGSTDDGSTDDGSTDDGSTDDGSTDDGSTDDGSTDDGSGDDGSGDDGDMPRRGPSLPHRTQPI